MFMVANALSCGLCGTLWDTSRDVCVITALVSFNAHFVPRFFKLLFTHFFCLEFVNISVKKSSCSVRTL
jgi:hypothetical protein